MKKALVLLAIITITHLVNAGIIDAITDGIGDMGHTGTVSDPLEVGETIRFKLILNGHDNPSYISYGGYCIEAIDLTLDVSGPACLDTVNHTKKGGDPIIDYDIGFSMFWYEGFSCSGIEQILGSATMLICANYDSPKDLIWNLELQANDSGQIIVSFPTGYHTLECDPLFPWLSCGIFYDIEDLTLYAAQRDPNAIVIDVVAGIGDMGHTGGPGDPLAVGERLPIKLVLNHYPFLNNSSYDGYLLNSMAIKMITTGPVTLTYAPDDEIPVVPWEPTFHPNFAAATPPIIDNAIEIDAVALTLINGPADLLWDMYIQYTGGCADIRIFLQTNGVTDYSPFSTPDGLNPYPGGWIQITGGSDIPIPGDTDGDFDVDDTDMINIVGAWLSSYGEANWNQDYNFYPHDCQIDLKDIAKLAKNWRIGVP